MPLELLLQIQISLSVINILLITFLIFVYILGQDETEINNLNTDL
jgi:hypothetical protein